MSQADYSSPFVFARSVPVYKQRTVEDIIVIGPSGHHGAVGFQSQRMKQPGIDLFEIAPMGDFALTAAIVALCQGSAVRFQTHRMIP